MAKGKKQEDNRDIFEKVLDALPLAAGALGARAGYKATEKAWRAKAKKPNFTSRYMGTLSGVGAGTLAAAPTAGLVAAVKDAKRRKDEKERRK